MDKILKGTTGTVHVTSFMFWYFMNNRDCYQIGGPPGSAGTPNGTLRPDGFLASWSSFADHISGQAEPTAINDDIPVEVTVPVEATAGIYLLEITSLDADIDFFKSYGSVEFEVICPELEITSTKINP